MRHRGSEVYFYSSLKSVMSPGEKEMSARH